MASIPGPGDPAPDFTLEGTDGPFTLSDMRGRRVLLLFYPVDDSPVCTKQFCSYRDHSEEMERLGVVAVGISPQDLASKERFRTGHGLTVPLLADPGGEVAGAYGVRRRFGVKRSTFLIDEEGIVRAAKVHLLGLQYESIDDLRAMVEELPRATNSTPARQ
jgi:thioredoxin-dependent peroxiredoxin